MDERFKYLASRRNLEELYERVNNREKYLPETVEASVTELQERGEVFEDDVLAAIAADMDARRRHAESGGGYDGLFYNPDKVRQVQDPDAPAFYTKRAIYGFAIFFSVLFASVLFAMNVAKTDKKINALWVMLYGVAFTVVEVIIGSRITFSIGVAFIFGLVGSYPLNYFMCSAFLGKATLYRVRPVWAPLVVGLAIVCLFMYLLTLPVPH